jgi:hypothetical protein
VTSDRDLLGRPHEPLESEVLEVYRRLKALAARGDAPPCVRANARYALAVIWQAVNDLDLAHEQLDDAGV